MLTALLLSLVLQVPGYPNGCATCGVVAAIDVPALPIGALPAVPSTFLIAGWGFECESGAPVDRVDVFYSGDDGFFKAAPWWLLHLDFIVPRPDVQAAFVVACPAVARETGWQLTVFDAVPRGVRVLRVNIWRGAYMTQLTRTVAVQ